MKEHKKYKTIAYNKDGWERLNQSMTGGMFIGVGILVVLAGVKCIVDAAKGYSVDEADEVEEIEN